MNTVAGLQNALKLCSSEKVKDRSQGQEYVRDIFSSQENLLIFQETASRDGGAGWIAFFQCLFQVVVVEKKAAVKKGAATQGEIIPLSFSNTFKLVVFWASPEQGHYVKDCMSLFANFLTAS